MKLKKLKESVVDSNTDILLNKTFKDVKQELLDLYYSDKPIDASKANQTFNKSYCVFIDETNNITESVTISVYWSYDENGELCDGGMSADLRLTPPVIQDDLTSYVVEASLIDPTGPLFDKLENNQLIEFPNDEFVSFGEEQFVIQYLGLYNNIETELLQIANKWHTKWPQFITQP